MKTIKASGLYDQTKEIRVGIVNNKANIIEDNRLKDPKIKIIGHGPSRLYERLTIHTMRKDSENEICQYWYVHTKGISYYSDDFFDYHKRECVIDWIKLLIFWNLIKWRIASNRLFTHDVYGCEFTHNPTPHFSGNFWWANSQYIKTLPNIIGKKYCDPEFWILNRNKSLICNIFSSGLDGGQHYSHKSNFFTHFTKT
jgi:hypothetical protein